MTVIEKVAYLKGLAEGLGLDESSKQDKLIKAMIEVLDEIAISLTDLEDDVIDLSDQIDAVDEDLADVEEELFGEDDDEESEEEFYEVFCPSCGEEIYLDDEMLEEESIDCPACGAELEFDFTCDCDDEDCDCDCEKE